MATTPFGKLTIAERDSSDNLINETLGYVKVNPFDSSGDYDMNSLRSFARGFVENLTNNTLTNSKITYEVDLDDFPIDSDSE